MTDKHVCELKCLNCGKWFKSGIQFESASSYFSSTLVGNTQQCSHCGKMTELSKENMRFSYYPD